MRNTDRLRSVGANSVHVAIIRFENPPEIGTMFVQGLQAQYAERAGRGYSGYCLYGLVLWLCIDRAHNLSDPGLRAPAIGYQLMSTVYLQALCAEGASHAAIDCCVYQCATLIAIYRAQNLSEPGLRVPVCRCRSIAVMPRWNIVFSLFTGLDQSPARSLPPLG